MITHPLSKAELKKIYSELESLTGWALFNGDDRLVFSMGYQHLPESGKAESIVLSKLKELGYSELMGLRVNRLLPHQFIELHMDNAFPGYDTVIINVTDDQRLRYRDSGLMTSITTQGVTILPEGTYHDVTTGDDTRYSIIGWVRKPNTTSPFTILELGWRPGGWSDLLNSAVKIARLAGRDITFNFQDVLVLADGTTSTKKEKPDSGPTNKILDLRNKIIL